MGVLVLKRRFQQRVYIDVPPGWSGRIVVQVTETTPTYCRLGIDAADVVKVFREELLAKAAPAETADDAEFREGLA